jgi:hypothetical protein
MAKFNASEAANYGGQGGGGFFGISEDKGVKRVRFLYNNADDIEGFSVHKVEIDGKERYVNCPRSYKDPVDDCPFCREQMKTQVKLFIPVYNIDEDQIQIWDRGKKMFEKMTSLCSRYANKNNLVEHVFEVERHGKPKDTATTYEIYEVEKDDTQLEDFEEDMPKILGGLVLEKSAEDMEYYLEANEFPPEDDGEKPRRRGSSRREEPEDDEEEEERPARRESRPARRTPARRGDKF